MMSISIANASNADLCKSLAPPPTSKRGGEVGGRILKNLHVRLVLFIILIIGDGGSLLAQTVEQTDSLVNRFRIFEFKGAFSEGEQDTLRRILVHDESRLAFDALHKLDPKPEYYFFLDRLKKIRRIIEQSKSKMAYVYIHKLEEIPKFYFIRYGERILDDYTMWNLAIVRSDYSVVLKSNEFGDDYFEEPKALDVNQDSHFDFIVDISADVMGAFEI
jgi:hypothetical protein